MSEKMPEFGGLKTPEKKEEEPKFYVVRAGGSESAASIKGPFSGDEARDYFEASEHDQIHQAIEIIDEAEAKRRITEEFNQYENYTTDITSPEEE